MVGLWGMSNVVGPLVVIAEDEQMPLYPGAEEVSPATRQLVDEEVRHLVEDAHEQVTRLLSANHEKLDALTQALLDRETLDQDEAYATAHMQPGNAGALGPNAIPLATGHDGAPK
jgi:cell division protease FtsH